MKGEIRFMTKLMDGACGSLLWAMAEERGIERKPVWIYSIEQPELVRDMHLRYIEAGADMIQTNTFAVNRPSVSRSSGYSTAEVIEAAVKCARTAVEKYSEENPGASLPEIYLSCGPLTQLLEPFGDVTKEECEEYYDEIVSAAAAAGIETVAFETFMDIEMMKIAAAAAKKHGLKVLCSMTFEARHRTMMGNTVETICEELEELGVDAVGMNCSKGPAPAAEIIKEYADTTKLPLYFKPNSGMGEHYDASQFAAEVAPVLPLVSYIGSCCGSDETFTAELKKLVMA